MSIESEAMMENPMFVAGYNEGLEYAARWITYALDGYSEETVNYVNANAISIRAAKREITQQNFFDAVRNDPYMSMAAKAYWLSLEPGL